MTSWLPLTTVSWKSPTLCVLRVARPEVEARFMRDPPWNAEVHASERDLDHILFHLGVPVTELSRTDPDPCPPVPPSVVVLRGDDNGGTFEVARCTSRCEADDTARRYEARGHKQTYWVESLPMH